MSRESKIHIAVTLAVFAVFAVVVYMIFFMARPSRDSVDGQRIDLQSMTAKRVPVLLEFGKGWCRPCKYMKPILDDVAQEYGEKAIVAAVDMDANYDLVRRFGIRVMPTQVFLLPDGKEFIRNEGVLEREDIRTVFSKMGLETAKAGQYQSGSASGRPPKAGPLPKEARQ